MKNVTVLFSTRNGAAVLPRVLQGYEAVAGKDNSWKIVVVDNGSTDETGDILRQFASRLPLTSQFHGEPGKNAALNSALACLEGEFVILTDDDAIPQENFLQSWRAVFDAQPQCNIFGGTVKPVFDVDPPTWLLECQSQFEALYSARSGEDGPIAPNKIFGPNMAVRKLVFDLGTRFNETIGPNERDKLYPMGSETEFTTRVASAGHLCWFASAPTVHHIVRPWQLTEEFYKTRAYRLGRGLARMQFSRGEFAPKRRSPVLAASAKTYRNLNLTRIWAKTLLSNQHYQALWHYHLCRGFEHECEAIRKAFRATSAPPARLAPATAQSGARDTAKLSTSV
jgi:glycosyltransferase involved in cell wall biosynthesis